MIPLGGSSIKDVRKWGEQGYGLLIKVYIGQRGGGGKNRKNLRTSFMDDPLQKNVAAQTNSFLVLCYCQRQIAKRFVTQTKGSTWISVTGSSAPLCKGLDLTELTEPLAELTPELELMLLL